MFGSLRVAAVSGDDLIAKSAGRCYKKVPNSLKPEDSTPLSPPLSGGKLKKASPDKGRLGGVGFEH
jgi:hypothetical protein